MQKIFLVDTENVNIRALKGANYLDENDCLVLNDTKVIPSRIYGIKEETDAHIELLLLKETAKDEHDFDPVRGDERFSRLLK